MELNEFFTTVILTAAVFAALVTSIANIIISLMNNWRLKKIEKQKQMNEIDKYRYSRLYELILNWHKYDSAQRGDTAEEIAFYRLLNLFMDDSGRYEIAKPLLDKTDIEPLVIEAVKELVSDKYFAKEIKKRIGVQTDTTAIDKELANYESKLKEVDLNKARLEREIDNLPIAARFRERKIHDMTLRLDGLYDTIVELEERIEDAKLRKSSIEMEAITLDNIYKLMLNFGKLYDIISDEEKKSLITYLIKEI